MIVRAPKIKVDDIGLMFVKYFNVERRATIDSNCEILVKFGSNFERVMSFTSSESPKNIREMFWYFYRIRCKRGR